MAYSIRYCSWQFFLDNINFLEDSRHDCNSRQWKLNRASNTAIRSQSKLLLHSRWRSAPRDFPRLSTIIKHSTSSNNFVDNCIPSRALVIDQTATKFHRHRKTVPGSRFIIHVPPFKRFRNEIPIENLSFFVSLNSPFQRLILRYTAFFRPDLAEHLIGRKTHSIDRILQNVKRCLRRVFENFRGLNSGVFV